MTSASPRYGEERAAVSVSRDVEISIKGNWLINEDGGLRTPQGRLNSPRLSGLVPAFFATSITRYSVQCIDTRVHGTATCYVNAV